MYGYQGGGNEFDAALGRIDNSKSVSNYKGEYIGAGKHMLVVTELETEGNNPQTNEGPKVRVYFEVLQSTGTHKPGDLLVRIYKLTKPAPKPSMTTDADQFAELIRKLSGAPQGTNVTQFSRALLIERRDEQLLRGMLVEAFGTMNKKGNYVNVAWTTVSQTQAEILHRRQMLDSKVSAPPQQYAPPPVPQQLAAQWPTPTSSQPIMTQVVQAPQPWPPQVPPQAAAPSPQQQPGALLSQIPGFNK